MAAEATTGVDIAVLDVDHFKTVNDRGGHPEGDELLRAITQRLQRAHPTAAVARMGGDEFAVPAPAGTRCVQAWADSLRTAGAHDSRVTISVGATRLTARPAGLDDVVTAVHRADAALYSAKRRGGNTTIVC